MRWSLPWLVLACGCNLVAGLGDFTDVAAGGVGGTAGAGGRAAGGNMGGQTNTGGGGTGGGGSGTGGDFGAPEVLASSLAFPLELDIDNTHVYVSESRAAGSGNGNVFRIRKDGAGGPEVLALGQPSPEAVLVDASFTYFYCEGDNTLRRVLKSGGTVEDVATVILSGADVSNISGMALVGDTIYVADEDRGIYHTPRMPGSSFNDLNMTVGVPSDIVLDADFTYTNDKTGDRVMRTALVGGASNAIISSIPGPRGLTLVGNVLYATAKDTDEIYRLDLADSAAEVFADVPFPHRVASDGTHVFVTSRTDCSQTTSVYAVNIATTAVVEIAQDQACPLAIRVDDEGVYFVNTGNLTGNNGSVVRVPKLY